MATYKKNGWSPEEEKLIEVTKKTTKAVIESVKTSMFPFNFSDILFKDIRETFLYRFILNFLGGLLIIAFIILILYFGAVFVTWSIPKGNNTPMDEGDKMFFRLLLLGYTFIILCFSLAED